jgi:hypothetical protein
MTREYLKIIPDVICTKESVWDEDPAWSEEHVSYFLCSMRAAIPFARGNSEKNGEFSYQAPQYLETNHCSTIF